jgi:hypothetical protein
MTIYKHYKKKEEDYIILDVCLLQDSNGGWKEAVFYKGLKSDLKFARFEEEFGKEYNII